MGNNPVNWIDPDGLEPTQKEYDNLHRAIDRKMESVSRGGWQWLEPASWPIHIIPEWLHEREKKRQVTFEKCFMKKYNEKCTMCKKPNDDCPLSEPRECLDCIKMCRQECMRTLFSY